MGCPICRQKINLLPGPNQDEWIIKNHKLYHLTCYKAQQPQKHLGDENYATNGEEKDSTSVLSDM